VITVNDEKKSFHLPDNKLMKEFMHRHFPEATFTVLKGDTEEEIIRFLKMNGKDTLVVLGSSQRNMISRLFKRGIVDALIEKTQLPLFTVHN
jgi:K+-sensing histidine kinase KdpD